MKKLFIDIGPLQEKEYTGVSAVAARIAKLFLRCEEFNAYFFWEHFIIPKSVVKILVEISDGRYFQDVVRSQKHNLKTILSIANPTDLVFYVNTGGFRRITNNQVQFIHDLTTVLFPETHNVDTVQYHVRDFINAKKNIDSFICNSNSTKDDVCYYLGIPENRVSVAYLGVDYPVKPEILIDEKYICVLGTFEPRKNNELILRMINEYPHWLKRYKFVFVGRMGWGPHIDKIISKYSVVQDGIKQKRILFTGYLSEKDKWIILSNASASIYASLYEGFGLPVLESIACHVPVAASWSSSLPEVGGSIAFYFDPFDVSSLNDAIERALKQEIKNFIYDDHLNYFSWSNFENNILSLFTKFII